MTRPLRLLGRLALVFGIVLGIGMLFSRPFGPWLILPMAQSVVTGLFAWIVCSVLADNLDLARENNLLLESIQREARGR